MIVTRRYCLKLFVHARGSGVCTVRRSTRQHGCTSPPTIPTLLEVKILASRNFHCPLDNLGFVTFLNLTTLSFRGIEVAAVLTLAQRFDALAQRVRDACPCLTLGTKAEHLFSALSQCQASQTFEHIIISFKNGTEEHWDEFLDSFFSSSSCTH
jgi:hypothetical protein